VDDQDEEKKKTLTKSVNGSPKTHLKMSPSRNGGERSTPIDLTCKFSIEDYLRLMSFWKTLKPTLAQTKDFYETEPRFTDNHCKKIRNIMKVWVENHKTWTCNCKRDLETILNLQITIFFPSCCPESMECAQCVGIKCDKGQAEYKCQLCNSKWDPTTRLKFYNVKNIINHRYVMKDNKLITEFKVLWELGNV
jgi:hypothetical protein